MNLIKKLRHKWTEDVYNGFSDSLKLIIQGNRMEKIKGVLPQDPALDCEVFISAKKGQSSVRITQALLNKATAQAEKLGKKPKVTVNIPRNEKESYTFTFYVNIQRNA